MRIKKLACVCLVLIISIAFFIQTASANQTEEVKFSLTAWGLPLKSVLSDIKQKTGYTVNVEGQITSDSISGIYNNVTVIDFFSMVLKEKDISILTDPEKKTIKISRINSGTIVNQNGTEQDIDVFLSDEIEYVIQAKESAKEISDKERQKLNIDTLTGKPWDEVELMLRLPRNPKKGKLTNEEEFHASEAEYILQAKHSIKKPSKKEIQALRIDPLTGKPWQEAEQQLRPARSSNKGKATSEEEFLAEADHL